MVPAALVAGESPQPAARRSRAISGMDLQPDLTAVVGVNLDEPLLTANDVAALLAVPRSSVYEYARRQHTPLPSIGIGRHRRFYRSDLEAWLTHQRDQAPR